VSRQCLLKEVETKKKKKKKATAIVLVLAGHNSVTLSHAATPFVRP
jgi:hypothetical protein